MASQAIISPDLTEFLTSADFPRKTLRLPKHQIVFKGGDSADAVFYILHGRVLGYLSTDRERRAVVAVDNAGDFFGLRCLVEKLRVLTAETLTDCQVMRIEKPAIPRLLCEQSAFRELLARYLVVRCNRVEDAVLDQVFYSGEKRLARALLMLAHFKNRNVPMPAIAKINHEKLAEMIGITRSRVNFFMNKFRRLGYIDYSENLKVHNSLLSVLSTGDFLHEDTVGPGRFGRAVPSERTGELTLL